MRRFWLWCCRFISFSRISFAVSWHKLDAFTLEVGDKLLHETNEMDREIRDTAVLFLDIRNFATFSESWNPREVVRLL